MSGTTMMPATLRIHLLACADFAAEDMVTQHRLAVTLWKAIEPRRQHKAYPGSAMFSKADMRGIWGSENALYKALAGKHFLVFKGDNISGITNSYMPTDEMLEAAYRCLRDPEPVELMNQEGKLVRAFPTAIDPRRAFSHTRADEWRDARPANAVAISEDGLLEYEPFATPLEKQMIAGLLRIARNTIQPGAVPHRYVQYSTGRLFAGRLSLQFASRRVRAAALAGCSDYDIANCHFAIMKGLAHQLGLPTHVIDHYVANKQAIREAVAQDVGITVKQAKECLLMIVYGATLSTSEHAALPKKIGKVAAARLQQNQFFAAMHAELQRLRQPIIDAHVKPGGWVVNAMGLRITRKESHRVLLSHIAQGYEAVALRAVVRRHGSGILLCLHDGWVTREPLDVAQCEADIMAATGLPLRIEEDRLEHPLHGGRVRIDPAEVEAELPLQDQVLTEDDGFSYDSSSPLQGCPVALLRRRRVEPGDIMRLSPRADWNYLPD